MISFLLIFIVSGILAAVVTYGIIFRKDAKDFGEQLDEFERERERLEEQYPFLTFREAAAVEVLEKAKHEQQREYAD